MKRKNYKVKVKLIFETTMDHSQTSMQKAQEDVNRVLTDYLKDKGIFLTLNLMIFIVISIFMYIADISFVMILFIFCIWFLPLFTYIFIEYIKYKKYFNDMESILESLDKKYLLPEVMEEANFLILLSLSSLLRTFASGQVCVL